MRPQGFQKLRERERKKMKTHKLRNILHSMNFRKHSKPTVLFISALFIISMLSFVSPAAVHASTSIFSENFASKNFNAWAISNNNGGTESVQTATVYGGSNIAKFTLPYTANSWAVITKNLGTTYSTLYLAGYVCLDALPSSGNYLMAGITLDSINGYDLASAHIHNNAGTYRWTLEYSSSGGKSNYVDSSLGSSISVGTWYYIEVMSKVGSGTGETTMWVNNAQILDVTGLTNNYDGASQIIQIGPYSSSAVTLNDYIDTISASTSFITMPTPPTTSSPTTSPTPTPAPTATPTPTPTQTSGTQQSTNLAPSPTGWSTSTNGMHIAIGGVSNDVLSNSVLYNGQDSIEILPAGNSGNTYRECDGPYISIAPGDQIVFSCWIKTTASSLGDTNPNSGGRIGIDFYSNTGRITGTASPDGSVWTPTTGYPSNTYLNYVHWGTSTWTQVTMSFTIPSTYPADGASGGYYAGQPVTPTAILPWMQVWSSTYGASDQGQAWFANPQLTITTP